jgi:hypothetical protein
MQNYFPPQAGRFRFIFHLVSPHHQPASKILEVGFLYLIYPLSSIKPVLQALNLTCNVWGDPTPEVSWLKNEKPLVSSDHCSLKYESGKIVYFAIMGVSTADSGKYGLVVKNKFGSEISDFTVSVFIPEEEARKAVSESQKGNKKSK